MKYLLGIDIGTSATKSVLFDAEGTAVCSASAEYPLYQPNPSWAEQDPDDWWNATCVTINQILQKSGVKAEEIAGVGLSGQMHGAVVLDKDNRPLRRSIIWCDQRTAAECDQITSIIGKERLIEITANPALTGFTASKIMWIKNNEPHIFEQAKKIILPKDYIRFKLTGEFATDVSDASGMQLLDVKNRCFSSEVLSKLGLDSGLFAKVYESCQVTGTVLPNSPSGLAAGTIVVGGAGDQAAGAVGNAIVKQGVISSTIGTSGVVFAHTDQPLIDPKGRVHTFCHAVPGAWHIMGVTQAAGLSLKWFSDTLCQSEKQTAALLNMDVYQLLDQMAEKIEPGAGKLIYLPYLMGERTPHLDPYCKGSFVGLTPIHTKAHLIRSVLEGIVFSLNDCLEIIREMGVGASSIMASGGGGKSPLLCQMQADVFSSQVNTIKGGEGGALGVAILAGVGAGIYSTVEQGCQVAVKQNKTYLPDSAANAEYCKYYQIYKDLYQGLNKSFKALAAL